MTSRGVPSSSFSSGSKLPGGPWIERTRDTDPNLATLTTAQQVGLGRQRKRQPVRGRVLVDRALAAYWAIGQESHLKPIARIDGAPEHIITEHRVTVDRGEERQWLARALR